jgi:hypothetical protein
VSTAATEIIRAALSIRTTADAEHVDQLLAKNGAPFYRPIGDRVNNFGLITTSASYDFTLIENVTNMQDALLERAAAARFGDPSRTPYQAPYDAAHALFRGRGDADLARAATVEFFQADKPARHSKRVTVVFRDEGCGIEPGYVADSIFALGSAHKSKAIWQQGAFGIGGATTFRNADAVVLVSRCAPELQPLEDRILVAVCLWQHSEKGKGLFYRVTSDWAEGQNRAALPWSVRADAFPDFAPGTHLALINYGTERLHAIRHSDNPNSFDRILDTRLFRPVSPTRFRNHLIRNDHPRVRRGLAKRFEDNPRPDRLARTEFMPFRVGDRTYQLPVTFFFFDASESGEAGATVGDKRNFVAHGHSLIFTSNGQTHHHWAPLEFRDRTKLHKLADRVLVVVETDPLPIKVRTDFFTADRSGVRASEETLRLESNIAEFLAGWDELRDLNNRLILEAIRSSRNERPTLEVSRQISRAYAARVNGFGARKTDGANADAPPQREKGPKPPPVLRSDPTILTGPESVRATPGSSKTIRFAVDARDEFFASGRGNVTVHCTHPDVGSEDIAVGQVRAGRFRVIATIPAEAQTGGFELKVGIYGWERAAGGLGDDLEWTTALDVIEEIESRPPRRRESKGRPSTGPQVALLWRHGEEVELTPKMPGKVEETPARLLAQDPEYAELGAQGDTPVLTIYLNEDYAPLKRYISARQRELVRNGSTPAHDRYAIDLGVALLVLHHEREERVKRGEGIDDGLLEVAREAAARGAVSILPQFDELVRQVGAEENGALVVR